MLFEPNEASRPAFFRLPPPFLRGVQQGITSPYCQLPPTPELLPSAQPYPPDKISLTPPLILPLALFLPFVRVYL